MINLKNILILGIFLESISFHGYSQREVEFGRLEPILQVFGSAAYDIDSDHYSFGFSRAHVGFQYQVSDQWSARLILDRGLPTLAEDKSKEGAYYTMFLKFASIKWQPTERFEMEGGAILQNHYITQEKFWGLRYVAQTFQDKYWMIPSSDLGFIARLKINDYMAVDAALTNGEGPRRNQDPLGRIKLASGLDFKAGDIFESRIYYHYLQLPFEQLPSEQMFSVFSGLRLPEAWRLGLEYNYRTTNLNGERAVSSGMSTFAVWRFHPAVDLFLRYDYLNNPSEAFNWNRPGGHAILTGLSCSVDPKVRFSLNYQGWMGKESARSLRHMVLFSMEFKT